MIDAQTIDRILGFEAGGLPVVSLYAVVPADPGERGALRNRVHGLLHEVRRAADETPDHDARLSLRGDLERIEEAAAGTRWKPPAVAVFSCSGRGFYEEVPLPRRVRERAVLDTGPWVRPMLALLDELHRTCVAVLDAAEARIWELYQGELVAARRFRDPHLRKPDFAGWHGLEERRVRNRADELERAHFRRLAAELDALFRRDRYDLLVLGGHEEEVERFLGFLPRALAERLAGTFALDPRTATLEEVRRRADEIVERYQREEERRLVQEALEAAAAGGRAVLGLERCLEAGSLAAVRLLLVHDEAAAPGAVCDACRWLAAREGPCPLCGEPMRPTADVVEELIETVIDEGGAVEHVHAETELAGHLLAAALRFPLPPASG